MPQLQAAHLPQFLLAAMAMLLSLMGCCHRGCLLDITTAKPQEMAQNGCTFPPGRLDCCSCNSLPSSIPPGHSSSCSIYVAVALGSLSSGFVSACNTCAWLSDDVEACLAEFHLLAPMGRTLTQACPTPLSLRMTLPLTRPGQDVLPIYTAMHTTACPVSTGTRQTRTSCCCNGDRY